MIKFIQKMIADKKEYKEQMERVKALPEDYRFVFEKMNTYIFSITFSCFMGYCLHSDICF